MKRLGGASDGLRGADGRGRRGVQPRPGPGHWRQPARGGGQRRPGPGARRRPAPVARSPPPNAVSDPARSAVEATAVPFAAALRGGGVAATAKHFPGLGAAAGNTDFAAQRVDLPKRTLRAVDERPYRRFAAAAGDLVMLSTAIYPAFSAEAGRLAPGRSRPVSCGGASASAGSRSPTRSSRPRCATSVAPPLLHGRRALPGPTCSSSPTTAPPWPPAGPARLMRGTQCPRRLRSLGRPGPAPAPFVGAQCGSPTLIFTSPGPGSGVVSSKTFTRSRPDPLAAYIAASARPSTVS